MTKEQAILFICANCSENDRCKNHGRKDCASIAAVTALKQEEDKLKINNQ